MPKDSLSEKRRDLVSLMRQAGKNSPALEADIARLDPVTVDELITYYGSGAPGFID